jgi:peptidoglycan-N-acetylglucosamine deacetylase
MIRALRQSRSKRPPNRSKPSQIARSPLIPTPRKTLCVAGLLAAFPICGAGSAGADTTPEGSGHGDLQRAALSQAGRDLIVTLRTAAPAPLARLERLPSPAAGGRYLCVELSEAGSEAGRRLCLGGAESSRRIAGLELLDDEGKVAGKKTVAVRVKRPEPTQLVVALRPAAAGLRPHRYRWRAIEGRGPCGATAGEPCAESLPATGLRAFRLRPVRPVGCTGGSAGLDTNGPRGRKAVALTFDDGPSEYTPGFLRVLRAARVPGTFFEVGQEMAGREATMRRILAEGDEIGDHTMNHVEYPGYAQIAGAAARVEAITHFRPCLFRPPGGALNSSVIATAGALGMRTITWDVDPRDWSTPGTAAIYSTIVGTARPGSIVLMHDGGGNRSETLAALPQVIATLRARGYRFETVTRLLGNRLIYRPYG